MRTPLVPCQSERISRYGFRKQRCARYNGRPIDAGQLGAEARHVTSSLLRRDSRSLKQTEGLAGVPPAAAHVPLAASDSAGRAPQETPARDPSPGGQDGISSNDSGSAGSAGSTPSAVAASDSARCSLLRYAVLGRFWPTLSRGRPIRSSRDSPIRAGS